MMHHNFRIVLFVSFFLMTKKEPAIHGIPNQSGFGCWFASLTQCLFRIPEVREAILNFDPDSLHVDLEINEASRNALRTFTLLKKQFEALTECQDSIKHPELKLSIEQEQNLNNIELLESLHVGGQTIWAESRKQGADSRLGLEALLEMFANIGKKNDKYTDFNAFASPLRDFLCLETSQSNFSTTIRYMTGNSGYKTPVLNSLDQMLFLPKFIVLANQGFNEQRLNPPNELIFPEPMDYVLSGKDESKCTTKVLYRTYAYVLYLQPSGGHAISLINTRNAGWVLFDDISTKPVDIKDIKFSSSMWPALVFYSKVLN